MEANSATIDRRDERRVPAWLVGLLPLLLLGAAIGLFVALGAPGLERNGIPVEEVSVERTVLRPGEIELVVRNDGPDPVAISQVMVMSGFDTNFDRGNEFYVVNGVAFAYHDKPIRVKRDELVRIYLVNVTEFDLLNSFHLHANFFDWYPTGTKLEPRDFTDTVILGQGERGIIEVRFPYTGKYMFHAHVSEFADLGWMGFFEVV